MAGQNEGQQRSIEERLPQENSQPAAPALRSEYLKNLSDLAKLNDRTLAFNQDGAGPKNDNQRPVSDTQNRTLTAADKSKLSKEFADLFRDGQVSPDELKKCDQILNSAYNASGNEGVNSVLDMASARLEENSKFHLSHEVSDQHKDSRTIRLTSADKPNGERTEFTWWPGDEPAKPPEQQITFNPEQQQLIKTAASALAENSESDAAKTAFSSALREAFLKDGPEGMKAAAKAIDKELASKSSFRLKEFPDAELPKEFQPVIGDHEYARGYDLSKSENGKQTHKYLAYWPDKAADLAVDIDKSMKGTDKAAVDTEFRQSMKEAHEHGGPPAVAQLLQDISAALKYKNYDFLEVDPNHSVLPDGQRQFLTNFPNDGHIFAITDKQKNNQPSRYVDWVEPKPKPVPEQPQQPKRSRSA